MHATVSTNMTCGSCVSKIKPLLDEDATILSWQPDLDDPRKLVRAELSSEGSASRVAMLIEQAGFRAEPIANADQIAAKSATRYGEKPDGPTPDSSKPAFQLETYKPLFLVVTYVIGGSILLESIHDQWIWTRAMTYFMGLFFLGFAFFKLLNISKFADAFATYDVIARRSRGYALAYPWIEVALGLLFVTGTLLVAANLITVAVMGIGLVGVVSAVRKKQMIQCACLGTAFNLPMSVVTIIENSVMVAMALAMLLI